MLAKDQKWIRDTISHKKTNSVPYHFDFTLPARKKLIDYYNSDNLEDLLHLPICWMEPNTKKFLYYDPIKQVEKYKDEFGVIWIVSENDRGVPIPCLHEPEITQYRYPDPKEPYRFEGLGKWCNENCNHYRVMWIGDLWERATFIRGMENMLLDVALNRDFVQKLLRGLTDYILTTMEILIKKCEFECFALSDDYGTQRSLIMSPDDWRKLIKPFVKEIFINAKKYGKEIFLHSCGNIYPIIGDLIDIGLDILHPIQPEAMDIYKLKTEYGKDITFQGGIGTQNLLLFGKPVEIKKAIRKLKIEMGKGGGYILEPAITVQGDVPVENLIAMIEESII